MLPPGPDDARAFGAAVRSRASAFQSARALQSATRRGLVPRVLSLSRSQSTHLSRMRTMRDSQAAGITPGRATWSNAKSRASFVATTYDGSTTFRITDRDMAMLQAVARFRFFSSDQLHRIVGGSERGVRNRLLSHARRLPRACCSGRDRALAYGLANNGARLLAERGHAINHRLDWADKNDRTIIFWPTPCGRRGDAALSSVRRVDRAAASSIITTLLSDMPRATRNTRDPFCLRVSVRHHDKASDNPGHPRPAVRA